LSISDHDLNIDIYFFTQHTRAKYRYQNMLVFCIFNVPLEEHFALDDSVDEKKIFFFKILLNHLIMDCVKKFCFSSLFL